MEKKKRLREPDSHQPHNLGQYLRIHRRDPPPKTRLTTHSFIHSHIRTINMYEAPSILLLWGSSHWSYKREWPQQQTRTKTPSQWNLVEKTDNRQICKIYSTSNGVGKIKWEMDYKIKCLAWYGIAILNKVVRGALLGIWYVNKDLK